MALAADNPAAGVEPAARTSQFLATFVRDGRARSLLVAVVCGGLGFLVASLDVEIPHTPIVLDLRMLLGFVGVGLAARWWAAPILALFLATGGDHRDVGFLTASLCNFLYMVVQLQLGYHVFHRIGPRMRNLLAYGLLVLLVVVASYVLISQPVLGLEIGVIFSTLSWQQWWGFVASMPLAFEAVVVGLLSAMVLAMVRQGVQLSQSERRYRALVESAADAIVAVDPDTGLIVDCNRQAVALSGRRRDELIGCHHSLLYPPEIREEAIETFRNLPPDRPAMREFTVLAGDGSRRLVEVNSTMVPSPGGRDLRMGIVRDVTARHEAQRMAERFFRQSLVLQCIFDREGNMVRVNPAFLRVLGYSEDELIGKRGTHLLHPDDIQATTKVTERVSRGEVIEGFRNRWKGRDGQYHVLEWTANMDPQLGQIYAVAVDMTERDRLAERLRQSEKIQAVGQLAGGVAHDFNNLLQAMGGYAQLGEELAADNEELSAYLSEISRAVARASRLVRQLLLFSRQSGTEKRPVRLSGIVRGLEEMLKRLLGEHVHLKVELPSPGPMIRADTAMVETLLVNLCVNARDAMPDGGTLTISVTSQDLPPQTGQADEAAEEGNSWACLNVADTGAGIPPDLRERIFEPFFTTKPVGKGTGLGLATVQGIAAEHGGAIDCTSVPGEGSSFTVCFPAVDSEDDLPQDTARSTAIQGNGETILLAEDDDLVRHLAETVLSKAGYRLAVATDGAQAVQIARDDRDIDLALMDVVMPVMGGREAAGQILKLRPRLPILLMTGYDDQHLAGDSAGRNLHVLRKPYTPAELLLAVRKQLDSVATEP